ncbi:MAG: site-specific DNA-methyltransferase [Bacteroidaceae bacterium]|nr:site-specific DNA-methyltransferase [Bacteroidaceae bacterium]
MEKLKMQSHDVIGSNIQKIAQLFPNCVTERLGKDGKPELAIDFEKLQAELSNEIIAEGEERYQFTWPDKRAASRLANTPTTMTLRPCREESVDFDNTQNLYIEGDNLDVLKVLRETYLGKVKMIYIDPPYNTGNDFVYNDDFTQGKGEFEQSSGSFDEEGNQTIDPMQRNTESNGRFHTDWLNMIYPRLKVARDLLSEDGVIFISIDDKEQGNLRKLCDEVFGENNLINNIIWQKKYSPQNDARWLSDNHDFILSYAKTKELWSPHLLPRTESMNERYKNPDNDPKGPWKLITLHAKSGRDTNFSYTFRNGVTWRPPSGTFPRFSLDTLKRYDEEGKIWFGVDGKSVPAVKNYLSEVKQGVTPLTIWTYEEVGHNQTAREDVKKCFNGSNPFDTPKPVSLIERICYISNTSHDSVVLDFFSGSATTAHAVMKLNAQDGGNRKFIMVQLPEKTDEKSEAYKAGYKNICEIGKERIRRAGAKIRNEVLGERNEKLDTGFRVLKLDSSNMEDVYYTPSEFGVQSLFNENVKSDRTNEDLLFQVMLDLGIELSAKIETKQIAGKTVHFVDDNYLVACFDAEVNETTITEIAKLQPIYFVMRDASAANDNVIDNFEQIFRHYSPDTVCRII